MNSFDFFLNLSEFYLQFLHQPSSLSTLFSLSILMSPELTRIYLNSNAYINTNIFKFK